MEYFAHSKNGATPPQSYSRHVAEVCRLAEMKARGAASYLYPIDRRESLVRTVSYAASYHDLGKLLDANAAALRSESRASLPMNHVDAGVAACKAVSLASALLVFSHHLGLPNKSEAFNKGGGETEPLRDPVVKSAVDEQLSECMERHRRLLPSEPQPTGTWPSGSIPWRIALSCLVDADHEDTSAHYSGQKPKEGAPLLPEKRLAALRTYLRKLNDKAPKSTRNCLRERILSACLGAPDSIRILACDSPVGTGKTTAIMAHMLRVAAANGLRRIFVVLPFTNIIDQAVKVYRDALTLPGEAPEDVIAAHHHRADFQDLEARQYTYLWRAPIVVVTAVQFFETIAACRTSALRKLHTLPGSAVFVDEAHAALPADLWVPAWAWLRQLHEHWSCHFVLGSGSLSRFWGFEEVKNVERLYGLPRIEIPDLIPNSLRAESLQSEEQRVSFTSVSEPLSIIDLADQVLASPGPRVVVLNTVRGAAELARRLLERCGRYRVEHLSTTLTPNDRKHTVEKIYLRLLDEEDSDWTLVATSCVEAGLNFSFLTGFRERFGLNNILQLSGRVCRESEREGKVYDFILDHPVQHPDARIPARVLAKLFEEGAVSPASCTEALRRELSLWGAERNRHDRITAADVSYEFKEVAELFRVIGTETVTVLVDKKVILRVLAGERVDFQEIQNASVQIWSSRINELPIEYPQKGGVGVWTGGYDPFLGIMAEERQGVLIV